MNKTVFFWIAEGQQYCDEALLSAESVRVAMPYSDRIIFAPTNQPTPCFAEGWTAPVGLQPVAAANWYLRATHYMLAAIRYLTSQGYERAIYLDTDTYVLSPVHELLGLLNKRTMAGAIAPGRVTIAPVRYIPESFPEINIGVLPMYLPDPTLTQLWDSVVCHYKLYEEAYGNNDQGALRAVLWDNPDFKFCTFQPEYNFRFGFGGFLKGEAKILHGRSQKRSYSEIGRLVNKESSFRVWKRGELS